MVAITFDIDRIATSLAYIATAHAQLEEGGVRGKIAIRVDTP